MGFEWMKRCGVWLQPLVMLVLLCSGWFLPAGEVITATGMRVIGIFAGVMWGWIFIDLLWPSLLGMLFLSLAGLGTAAEIFGRGFGSEIVLLILFFSLLTQWLEEIGLTNSMAQWLLSRQFLTGRPYLFLAMLFLVTFVVSFFVGIYATIFVMWGICYQLLQRLGYRKGEKLTTFVLLGVAYVSVMGMTVKPWSPWSLMGLQGLNTATGATMDFLPYSSFMLVISAASMALFLLIGKWVIGIDVAKLRQADHTHLRAQLHFDRKQQLGALLLLFMLLALYAPSILPKDWPLQMGLKSLGTVGIVVLLLVLLCVGKEHGQPIFSLPAAARQAIPWPMVCLLAAVGPLGDALMLEEAGIVRAMMQILQPLFAGQNMLVFYGLICLFCCLVTQFMNNTILLVVLTPIFCTLAEVFGANPLVACVLVTFSLTSALATPGASSRAGLVFGNTEWIETRQAYGQALLSVLAVFMVLLVIGIPLGLLLF